MLRYLHSSYSTGGPVARRINAVRSSLIVHPNARPITSAGLSFPSGTNPLLASQEAIRGAGEGHGVDACFHAEICSNRCSRRLRRLLPTMLSSASLGFFDAVGGKQLLGDIESQLWRQVCERDA
jgi:hypothetical protein